MSQKLYSILCDHLTPRKVELFEHVAQLRTKHITLVTENIYQAQNASAILRSTESFGVQDLHIIENDNSFQHHHRIAKGAQDWLTLYRYNDTRDNTSQCLQHLRSKGYQIAVTALHHECVSIHDLDITQKTAVVLGTELTGASQKALEMADVFVKIPMSGFTESMNVAGAAAVILENLSHRLRQSNVPWQLTPEEQLQLKILWARRTITWSDYLVQMFETGEINPQ
jgi:tRNA (guanosine-2'-O-)-methyltransferase